MDSLSATKSVTALHDAPAPRRKRRLTGVLIGVLALLAVAGYLFGGGGGGTEDDGPLVPSPRQFTPRNHFVVSSGARKGSRVSADDPTWGPKGAAATVVEFSDFQCPFCRDAFPVVRDMMRRYGDRVFFQYRDFPISEIHPDAQKAAEAAECAHAQGKFWEYHDRLFQNQEDLGREALTRYALAVNVDIASFNRCLDGGAKTQEVLQDFQDGVAAGVAGTPTFFINGIKYEGVLSLEEFQEIIDGLLGTSR